MFQVCFTVAVDSFETCTKPVPFTRPHQTQSQSNTSTGKQFLSQMSVLAMNLNKRCCKVKVEVIRLKQKKNSYQTMT